MPIRCSASERQPNGTTPTIGPPPGSHGGGPNLFNQGPRRNITCHIESACSSSRGSAPLLTIARISGRHAAGERSGCIDRHSVVASYSRWTVAKHLVKWVELRGFEPLTPTLPGPGRGREQARYYGIDRVGRGVGPGAVVKVVVRSVVKSVRISSSLRAALHHRQQLLGN